MSIGATVEEKRLRLEMLAEYFRHIFDAMGTKEKYRDIVGELFDAIFNGCAELNYEKVKEVTNRIIKTYNIEGDLKEQMENFYYKSHGIFRDRSSQQS